MRTSVLPRVLAFAGLVAALALAPVPALSAESGSESQAQRQVTQPLNNAPVWREVRKGDNQYQTTQVRGIETNVLIQSQGETWRQIHNGPLPLYGGLLLLVMLLLIFGYYQWKGPLRVHEKPTGRLIERFSDWERLVHWTTATSFVILAVSGLTTLLLIVRTALEDRTLRAELTGYVDYARQVRYRLLPGIW